MDNQETQAIKNGQSRDTGNTEYCLCLWIVHSLLPVSLDCPFFIACVFGLSILYCLCLWIVHSLFPVSLDCPFFIACVFGLSILYCLCLWIVHSLLPVSLDCPFFIRHRQYRMDNPETQAIKNGQSRDTGNKEWTIQRHRQ
jgi:hypothetical protein